jgi:hypothetical protein
MVFSAMDPPDTYGKGFVHCELSWSADGKNYTRVLPGHDFIPRGSIESKAFDSHICFASAHPVKLPNETRIYYMGGAPRIGLHAYIRLSLRSTAQPLYTRFPIIFGSCFF